MKTSESIAQLATALAIAQGEFEVAAKSNLNEFFKKGGKGTPYADITSVWKACRSALSKNGLAVIQSPAVDANRLLVLTTRIIHKSGEWIEDSLSLRPREDTAQALGSCITYARRYGLSAMVGVVAEDEDDDANAASLKDYQPKEAPQQPPKQAEPEKKTPEVEPKIFTSKNLQMVSWLDQFLTSKQISSESKAIIVEQMESKDINKDLIPLMTELKKQEQT